MKLKRKKYQVRCNQICRISLLVPAKIKLLLRRVNTETNVFYACLALTIHHCEKLLILTAEKVEIWN